jgi:RNA polymerase sigma-70 factor (ECF subfamily)
MLKPPANDSVTHRPDPRDPEAVEALVRTHHRSLRGYVAALCHDSAAVDDLSQEVFVRALRMIGRDPTSDGGVRDFAALLRGIARNVVCEHRRRGARESSRFAEAMAAELERADPGRPERRVDDAEVLDPLRRCVERLPYLSRRMLDLRYVEELTAEEIGRAVGSGAAAVRMSLLRIREGLVRCLRARLGAALGEVQP